MCTDLWQEAAEQIQTAVATLLGRLCAQPLHGPRVVLLLSRLLPPGLVAAIQVYPQAVFKCPVYAWAEIAAFPR